MHFIYIRLISLARVTFAFIGYSSAIQHLAYLKLPVIASNNMISSTQRIARKRPTQLYFYIVLLDFITDANKMRSIAYHRPNNTKKRYVNKKDLAWAPFTNMD